MPTAPFVTRSYSISEMKTFKKMAKAIRNVDEREGHSEATAAFIDAEFSDNPGKTVKSMRSGCAWRRNRVNAICEKAAIIMEDRPVTRMLELRHHESQCPPLAIALTH